MHYISVIPVEWYGSIKMNRITHSNIILLKHIGKLLIIITFLSCLFSKDYKGAELRTITSYTYGRFEVRMQSAAGSGMLSSFFTYHDAGIAWNEIDLEILGQYGDEVQFNVITPGQVNHVHESPTSFNPHLEFHTYAFEWTPTYVAWFIDGLEVYRDQGSHIQQLDLAQKIMMNMWIPDYPSWVGNWNDDILPLYAYYDWVKYYSFTPGSGDSGSNNNFTFQWVDNFDNWDQDRWQKATHTWWGNNCDFTPTNVVFQEGYMILCLTDNYNLGFSGEIPNDDTYLKTVGPDILDMNDNPILLRGLGLGGWLVPEGYMLHIPGYGSPTEIRNMITNLVGSSMTETFYELYEQNYVTAADIQQISEWGFNSIRLPFHYEKLSPAPGEYLESGFAQIDSLLNWCEANQLYLILDMHCAPGGQNHLNISDSNGEALLWSNDEYQAHTVEIWQTIAERYVYEKWIGGYDLINEPVLPDGYNNFHLRNLYVEITNAIRQVDLNHIIFIEGNWFATDFGLLSPPFDDNMVYSFHKYWNSTDTGSISNYLSLRDAYDVPLWLGETGENSNHWGAEVIQMVESENIGWNWWTHKKLDTTTSPLSVEIPEYFQDILDYWNDEGSQPPTYQAFSGLMQLAENISIENCQFRPDIIEVLFNESFQEDNIPFAENVIPGIIPAINYDMGMNNISYHDDDYMISNGDNSQSWNSGHKYRNDGVDIEICTDDGQIEYNIGWTEDDEWLEYTVDIAQTGNYVVNFSVAGFGGGWFHLKLDDEVLFMPTSVPDTDGWQNWQSLMVDFVYLIEGTHILQLYFSQGGFNIKSMEFFNQGLPGDVNNDQIIDIVDIVMVVDIIFNGTINNYQLWAADIYVDSNIDILDIVNIVDEILN